MKTDKDIVLDLLKSHTREMEGYSYFGPNPGVSEADYEELAEEIVEALDRKRGISP